MRKKIEKGWIRLHRKIQDNFLYPKNRPFTLFEAWIDLLLLVNHSEQAIDLKEGTVIIGRSQTIRSLETLSQRWNWDKSKLRRFLKLLQNKSMINYEPLSKTSKINNYNLSKMTQITICAYDRCQGGRQTAAESDTPNPLIDGDLQGKATHRIKSGDTPNPLNDKVLQETPTHQATHQNDSYRDKRHTQRPQIEQVTEVTNTPNDKPNKNDTNKNVGAGKSEAGDLLSRKLDNKSGIPSEKSEGIPGKSSEIPSLEMKTQDAKEKTDNDIYPLSDRIPTIEMVEEYCKKRKSIVPPALFMLHYESQHWKYEEGNNITNWKLRVLEWENDDSVKYITQINKKTGLEELEEEFQTLDQTT